MKIGVTGHQQLKGRVLKKWVESELKRYIENRSEIKIARSCLAVGADQLFATIVLELGIDLIGVIPSTGYESTFSHANQKQYQNLLERCRKIEILNFERPSEEAFFAGGKHVVDESDLLFAIWDGLPAKGLGGTADVVDYALSLGKAAVHLHVVSKTVIMLKGKPLQNL